MGAIHIQKVNGIDLEGVLTDPPVVRVVGRLLPRALYCVGVIARGFMVSGTLQSEGSARRVIWAARLVVLAAFFDLFVQFPTIAPHAESLGASTAFVGIIVAAYSFTNLFGNLGSGFALDRWGRRRPIIVGMAITAAAVISYSLVRTPEQFAAARAIHGIGAAVLAPGAFSMIGDQAVSNQRGRTMGVTGALIAIAALIGFPIAGILRDLRDADAVFLVDAAFIIATMLVFLLVTRETRHKPQYEGVDSGGEGARAGWRTPRLWSAYAAIFAITVGIGALVAYLPLVLEDRGETARQTSYGFAIYAVAAMVVMASPISRSGDRFGRFAPSMLGLLVVAVGLSALLSALGMFESYGGVIAGMAVYGMGYGLVFPAAAALVTESTGADRRGMAFGIFYAVYSLGVVVGSVGSTRLAELQDQPAGLPFFAAAVIALAVIPIVYALKPSTEGSNPRLKAPDA